MAQLSFLLLLPWWPQDKDNNGYVDVDELTNLHSTTKERLTMLEAKKILQVADTNGDGRMNYEEFLQFMTKHTVRDLRSLSFIRRGRGPRAPLSATAYSIAWPFSPRESIDRFVLEKSEPNRSSGRVVISAWIDRSSGRVLPTGSCLSMLDENHRPIQSRLKLKRKSCWRRKLSTALRVSLLQFRLPRSKPDFKKINRQISWGVRRLSR